MSSGTHARYVHRNKQYIELTSTACTTVYSEGQYTYTPPLFERPLRDVTAFCLVALVFQFLPRQSLRCPLTHKMFPKKFSKYLSDLCLFAVIV